MQITGIICEYNPLHLGHLKQINRIREQIGRDSGIVCLMSGNFVQRGAPAILDKTLRAKAAILSGADLVLELPVTCALSSAENFAAGGVKNCAIDGFCGSVKITPFLAGKPSAVKSVKELLSVLFKDVMKSLFVLACDVV